MSKSLVQIEIKRDEAFYIARFKSPRSLSKFGIFGCGKDKGDSIMDLVTTAQAIYLHLSPDKRKLDKLAAQMVKVLEGYFEP